MPLAPDGKALVHTCAGARRLRAGVLDENASSAYRLGQCHALSIAVSEATGWPIEAVITARIGRNDLDTLAADWALLESRQRRRILSKRWVHTAVRCPDGRLVDIDGVHADETRFLRDWGNDGVTTAARLVPVSADDLSCLHTMGSGVEADLAVARTFVDALVHLADTTVGAHQ